MTTTHTCAEAGCTREVAAKGYCWAHYQRQRRGSKKQGGEVNSYGLDVVHIGTIRVPSSVATIINLVAKQRKISNYALCVEVLKNALERTALGKPLYLSTERMPFYSGALVEVTNVSMPKVDVDALTRLAEENGDNNYELINKLVEDWYQAANASSPRATRS